MKKKDEIPTTEMRTILVPHWIRDHYEGWYLGGETTVEQQAWVVGGKKVWRDISPPDLAREWREPPTKFYAVDNYAHAKRLWRAK